MITEEAQVKSVYKYCSHNATQNVYTRFSHLTSIDTKNYWIFHICVVLF